MNTQYLFKPDIIISQKIILQDINDLSILIIKRSINQTKSGSWDLPGGCLLFGEQFEESLRREVFEETTIENIDQISIFNSYIYYDNNKCGINLGYQSFINKKEITIKLSPEHSDYKWISLNQALLLTDRPNIKNHLNAYLKSNKDK